MQPSSAVSKFLLLLTFLITGAYFCLHDTPDTAKPLRAQHSAQPTAHSQTPTTSATTMTVLNSKDEAKAFVEDTVNSNKVVIFSKTYCPFCIKAKKALTTLLQPDQYLAIELDKRQDIIVIQDALGDITGARTVPRVFVGGKFIGGGDDTANKAANGELKTLLEGVGAI